MEFDDTVHKVGNRVLIVAELYAATKDAALCRQAVKTDVLTVRDGLNQALINRLINLCPIGLDKSLSVPIEHAADADKRVFGVGV